MDALQRPKRRRKDRAKPDPCNGSLENKDAIKKRLMSLPTSPGVMAESTKDWGWRIAAPHSDSLLWEMQIHEAFGTRSSALAETFLQQLMKLCPEDFDEDCQQWRTNETEWNAILALVADQQPENSMQAAMAAQMAATHLMQIRLSAQALNRGGMVMEADAALASKLARTFAIQCETMMALQGKVRTSKQSIKVTKETHQHVHYHKHDGGEGAENDAQPDGPRDERTQTIEGCASLPRQSERNGKALPSPSDKGQAGLSQARRR